MINSKLINIFRKAIYFIAWILIIFISNIALSNNNGNQLINESLDNYNLTYESIKTIPILDNGRIKPLDSFARITLKSISNKESINKNPAINWLMDLLFNPSKDYNNKIFYIHNQDLKNTLELENKNKSYFSFKEVLPGIKKNINLISMLEAKRNDKELVFAPAEKQLLELYHKTITYFDLSRSFSFLIPEFNKSDVENLIADKNISKYDFFKSSNTNKLNYDNKLNYLQVALFKKDIANKVEDIVKNNSKNIDISNLSAQNAAVLSIAKKFKETAQDKINISLKIIPYNNQLNKSSLEEHIEQNWLSPWEISNNTIEAKQYSKYIDLWQNIIYSYYNSDHINWNINITELKNLSYEDITLHSKSINNISNKLNAEYYYNNLSLFNKSIGFYFLSLVLSIVLLTKSKPSYNTKENKHLSIYNILYKVNITGFLLASICHLIGILLRIYILNRPPVSNLYESILFVSIIISIITISIELSRKDNIGILIGSLICTVLQFIANSYAQSGDTLGVLIAVLDNNFWLGTHVIAITSGYGSCLILSALSHVYLLKSCIKPKDIKLYKHHINSLNNLKKYILAFGLISLFLTLLGTILGGIWADQSWGRFWGWDPKENGALLICLWLTAILHGRISGQLKDLAFITGAALTSITVVLAWFGVNLLGTGLHSYGFTENIALNIFLFVSLELILILGLFIINKLVNNNVNT